MAGTLLVICCDDENAWSDIGLGDLALSIDDEDANALAPNLFTSIGVSFLMDFGGSLPGSAQSTTLKYSMIVFILSLSLIRELTNGTGLGTCKNKDANCALSMPDKSTLNIRARSLVSYEESYLARCNTC